MDVYFNRGSPKSSSTLSLPTMLPLKEFMSCGDKKVNERKEGLNQFDLPAIFDDYSEKEVLGFENYGDKELKIKSDLKPYFECDHPENLRANSLRQGDDDAHIEAMMKRMGMIHLSPNMYKRNSKPRGNTKKVRVAFLEFAQ